MAATLKEHTQAPAIIGTMDVMLDSRLFNQVQAMANVMASGVSTVPKHLQSKPADCFAIAMQAAQWGMNPFAVAQKTHLVNGVLGYEAQLVNAVISSSQAIHGRFHYEYGGDWKSDTDPTAWVKVGAVIAGESEIQWGEPLYPAKVTTKNSPLWKTNPKQQAAYLAVKMWARLYCPAVILGVYTPDELNESPPIRDMGIADRVVTQTDIADKVEAIIAAMESADSIEVLEAESAKLAELGLDRNHPDRRRAASAFRARRDELTAKPEPQPEPVAEPVIDDWVAAATADIE